MAKRRRGIVLDKSYLQAAPYKAVRRLCQRYEVAMPDVLFFELMSNEQGRASCFRKLPEGDNPVKLLPGVGELLRIEIDTHGACGKPSARALDIAYKFNTKLAVGSLVFTEKQRQHVDDEVTMLRRDVDGLVQRVEAVATMFPQLLGGRDAERRALKEEIERTISSDRKALLTFYASLQPPPGAKPLPHPSRLRSNWAIFRWLQVNLLMGVDLLYRYKLTLQQPGVLTEKLATHLEHEVLDSHYVIIGALEGALATRDRNVRRLWHLLKPNALLVPRLL